MMIAIKKSHIDESSRGANDNEGSPSHYGCLSPSPSTSPNTLNNSVYHSSESPPSDIKDNQKTLDLSSQSFESGQEENFSNRVTTPSINRGKCFMLRLFEAKCVSINRFAESLHV